MKKFLIWLNFLLAGAFLGVAVAGAVIQMKIIYDRFGVFGGQFIVPHFSAWFYLATIPAFIFFSIGWNLYMKLKYEEYK